jgi:transposase
MEENLNLEHNRRRLFIKALALTNCEKGASELLGVSIRTIARLKGRYRIKYDATAGKYYQAKTRQFLDELFHESQ